VKPLGVGIVGLGDVAVAHARALGEVPGFAVVAGCTRRAIDRARIDSDFGVDFNVHANLEALLADPRVDVVDICTTHDLHAEQAIAAARAGKHLIVEKPIALSYEDLLAVRSAVSEAGVGFCVGFECRWGAHFTLARSLIDQGMLGSIHYAEVDYLHGLGPWYRQFDWNATRARGGGSLLAAGCHALDGLLHFVRAPVVEVMSYGTRSRHADFAPYAYEPTTVTLVRFADGAVGKVASVLDCIQPYHLRVHLFGSEGTLADDRFTSRRLPGLERDRWSRLATHRIESGEVEDHPYEPMFKAFHESLVEGNPMPLTGLVEAFATHRVIFAADRSAAERRPVRLEELAA
jgi:predicted dehydrogenase